MTSYRLPLGALLIVACGVLLPAEALAQQSGIAGAVRDTSGGALPGVTVEASSPALIEGSRTVVTDGQGLYTLVDLRPGAYVVTFSLPGFSTLRREGIELTAGFTATVNAELSLGTLEETITVSGEAPVVDIRNVRTQTTVDRETLTAIPTTGRMGQYASLIAGATLETTTLHDVGGVAGERGQFGVHGQRAGDISYVQDGVNTKVQTGGVFSLNNQTFQEVSIETSGMSAEAQTGGVQVKVVPRDGGNILSGNLAGAFSHPNLQGTNITDDLRARGLTSAPGLKKLDRHRRRPGRTDQAGQAVVLLCLPVLQRRPVSAGELLQQAPGDRHQQGSGLRRVCVRTRLEPSGSHRRLLHRSQSAADVAGRAQAQDRRVRDRQQQLQLPDVPAGAAERCAGGA